MSRPLAVADDDEIRANGQPLGTVSWKPPIMFARDGVFIPDPDGDHTIWLYRMVTYTLPN